ncbi:hypothetical protein K3495_g4092 [Podosphaera aphanis]|nr:hypothetical protein K3495_g4092 [Podosphaera aphanis]
MDQKDFVSLELTKVFLINLRLTTPKIAPSKSYRIKTTDPFCDSCSKWWRSGKVPVDRGEVLQMFKSTVKDDIAPRACSNHTDIQESADTEEPNVPSTEDEEPTELVNAEVEFILERSTTESRDVPTVAASLIDHTLSTTNKSPPLSSTMPPLSP